MKGTGMNTLATRRLKDALLFLAALPFLLIGGAFLVLLIGSLTDFGFVMVLIVALLLAIFVRLGRR
jgi:hypothetical protein